jgi:hypothetical protein
MSDPAWAEAYYMAFRAATGREPPKIVVWKHGWYVFSDSTGRRYRRAQIEEFTNRLSRIAAAGEPK